VLQLIELLLLLLAKATRELIDFMHRIYMYTDSLEVLVSRSTAVKMYGSPIQRLSSKI